MSVDDLFSVNVWYMTLDYKNMYRIEEVTDSVYNVIRFGDWAVMFKGTRQDCILYLNCYCWDHQSYERGMKHGE